MSRVSSLAAGVLIAMGVLSGCSLAPPRPLPAPGLPAGYPASATQAQMQSAEAALLDWQAMSSEAELNALISTGLARNYDARLASLNVRTVMAQYRIARAQRFPELVANGTGQRARQVTETSGTVASAITETSGANVGISAFELDLFGRAASLSDAAWENYQASVDGARATQLSLIGAIAQAYFNERAALVQQQLTGQTLSHWRDSVARIEQRYRLGQASSADLNQAQGQVAQAEADLQARERAHEQAMNALVLLLGGERPVLADIDAQRFAALAVRTQLPAGLPSDLLVRRPDVLQAEHVLESANANIGAARAAFFPRLTLTGEVGRASNALGGLFDTGTQTWSFAPQLSIPLFNAGRLRAELNVAKLRTSSAVVSYEKVVQTAFREVADGLAAQATYGTQLAAQQRAVDAAQTRERLSQLRYDAGQDGRLELLDAQREVYAAQQTLIDVRRDQLASSVFLFVALGGGADGT